ncbi:MAG TPA: hypothetical protein DEB39_00605, partial [Planctomycetaceae bacterium]|nr:hypothetical protein [Planctomycetaceae bacterium]
MVFATAFSTAVLTTGVTVFITAGASLLFAEETAETESRAVWKSVDTSDSTVTERDSLAPTSEVEDDLDEEIDTKKVDPALALPAAKTAGESQVSKPALFGKPVVGQPAGRRPAGQSVTTSSRPTASSAKAN